MIDEEKILDFWEKNKIFEKSISQRKNGKNYSFYDGPPFATGLPHYGHILGSVVKDVVPRYFAMKGYKVKRRWGWDCHGLPIENIIEKNFKINSKKEIEEFGIDKFNNAAREAVLTYDKEWKKTIRRIARFVDFDNSYKTMDNSYMETVWWVFNEFAKKGLIYEDTRISLYCPRCATPLSNFEIAMDNSYKEISESALAVKLKLLDEENTSLIAWTTTPWTLIGNVAAAINTDLKYVKVEIAGEYYILAKNRLSYLGSENYKIEKEFLGKDLVGRKYKKLYEINTNENENGWSILPGDFVSGDEGTGVVHIALYGEDDYKIAKKYNLPLIQHIGEDGRLIAGKEEWLGLWYKDLDKKVLEDLKNRNLLFKDEPHLHSYPFCYRCETPLYYALQPAWFAAIHKIRKKMIEANKKINWKPEHLKNGRFLNGIKTAPDWNISRSRYWGSPMPIWKCANCGEIKIIGSISELKKFSAAQNEFYIMRHGESDHNVNKIADGILEHSIVNLTKKGIKQVEKTVLALKKKDVKFDLIIASDFPRTKQTAEIAKVHLGIPEIVFDERLREISVGIFEGKPTKEYHKYFNSLLEKFYKNPPEGESLTDLKIKSASFLKEINEKYKNKKILIIGHEYSLWILSGVAQGLDNHEIINLRKGSNKDFIGLAETQKLKYEKLPLNKTGDLDLHRPYIDEIKLKCKKCGSTAERIKDVFDCWFESGSMPYAQNHYPFQNKQEFLKSFPSDFVAEYIAQTRGWFYTMHVMSTALFNKPAFKNVITTGTILAENGEKMSKSKKNYPDPSIIFDKYGVDSLRYYLMVSPVMLTSENINFSETAIKEIYNKVISTLQNTGNFFEIYGASKGKLNFDFKKLSILDKWILSRLESLVYEMDDNMKNYEVVRAARPVILFANDLSNWYIRRSRRRFQHPDDKKDTESANAVLAYVILKLSKAISIFTPFIAEELYQKVRNFDKEKKISVHLCDYPHANKKFINKKIDDKMSEVRNIAALGLKIRNEAGIKIRQPLALLKIRNFKSEILKNKELLELIKDELNIKEIIFDKNIENEVWLDMNITDELKEEGILRDVLRALQDLRKKTGLTPRDKPFLSVFGNSEGVEFIKKHSDTILKEANFSRIEFKNLALTDEHLTSKIMINGIEIHFNILK